LKTIAVIHTTPATINILKPLFNKLLNGFTVNNFLDESILKDIIKDSKITAGTRHRFHTLLLNAAMSKPDVILCACSSVGGLLEEGRELIDIPALRIDEPMTRQAVKQGTKIGIAATLDSTLQPTLDLLNRQAENTGRYIETEALVIKEAGLLLASGQMSEYNQLIAEKLQSMLERNDIVLLAQASMAGAIELLDEKAKKRVLTSPQSGIEAVKEFLF
jgi:Asp/Glu/hydantoin racemase